MAKEANLRPKKDHHDSRPVLGASPDGRVVGHWRPTGERSIGAWPDPGEEVPGGCAALSGAAVVKRTNCSLIAYSHEDSHTSSTGAI